MDKYGNIYRDDEDAIPAEDKARLEGYLTAKAEEGEFERAKRKLEEAWREMLATQEGEGATATPEKTE